MKLRPALFVLLCMLLAAGAPSRSAHAMPAADHFYRIAGGKNASVRTDGSYVTWYTYSAYPGDPVYSDVLAYDMGRRQLIEVAATPAYESNPAIDSGTVVWVESPTQQLPAPSTIRARNLRTNTSLEVAAVPESSLRPAPAISGDMVIWTVPADGYLRIMGRNIRTMEPPRALAEAPAGWNVYDLRIAGSWVAWVEQTTFDWNVQLLNLDSGVQQDVSTTLPWANSESGGYGCDLQPDLLVCRAGRHAIGMRSLGSGSTSSLIAPVGTSFGDLAAAGRYLIIKGSDPTENSPIPSAHEEFLFLYDRQTDSLARTPIIHNGLQTWMLHLDAEGEIITWTMRQGPNPSAEVTVNAAPLRELLPTARYDDRSAQERGVSYFPETGHNLGGLFKTFWERSGGLAVFGYPLTEELLERNPETGQLYTVQYFERQRFEHHPEHAGTPYEVQLGLLGVNILRAQGRDWETFPKASPTLPHYVPETGHATAAEFWPYWQSHGLEFGDPGISAREALALFGHPISEPAIETNSSGNSVLTQWFERARFEYHPDKAPEYRVLLGRLGAELLERRGWGQD
jgi:hypothetical protein